MTERERLFILGCIARLSHVIHPAESATTNRRRYRRMRSVAEEFYIRLSREG